MSLPDLDWALVRSFLAMARERSLAGAARRLGLAHPTARRHLEALEAELGGELFSRSPSGLALTDLGERLLEPAETMESAYGRLLRASAAGGDAPQGVVRITASEVVGVEVLPPILAGVRSRHPGIELELDVDDAVVDVLRRDADVAVRMTRPRQADLLARRVGTVELGLFVRQDHPAAAGAASLSDLVAARSLIGGDAEDALIRALETLGLAARRRDFAVRADSGLVQLAAVRAGLGAGVVQVPLAARDPRLRRLLPELSAALEIWLVVHPDLRSGRGVRAVTDALAAGLAAYAAEAPGRPGAGRDPA